MATVLCCRRALYTQSNKLLLTTKQTNAVIRKRWLSSSNKTGNETNASKSTELGKQTKKAGSSEFFWHAGTLAAFVASFAGVRWAIQKYGGSIIEDPDESQDEGGEST